MELRHLRYVLAVAEELHFTRAAERLGIGQPPLSHQIKQVEEEIGTRLFRRETRSVNLTEAGHAFLPHARAAIHAAEQAKIEARRAGRGELGQLRIGFTGSASFNPLVTGVISQFRAANPGIRLNLVEQATTHLIRGLKEDMVDIAFLRATIDEQAAFRVEALPDEPMCVALPPHHPLNGRQSVLMAELASESFILYPRENGSLLYDSIIACCQKAGFSPKIVQEAPQMASTVNLVATGVGIALVPVSMKQLHSTGVVYMPLVDPTPTTSLQVAYKISNRVPMIARRFMDQVAFYLAEQAKAPLKD